MQLIYFIVPVIVFVDDDDDDFGFCHQIIFGVVCY